MAHITSIVMTYSANENSEVVVGEDGENFGASFILGRDVNTWLRAHGHGPLVRLGHDHLQQAKSRWRVGSFEHFAELGEFIEYVNALPWKHPDQVVEIVRLDDGPTMVFRAIAESQSWIDLSQPTALTHVNVAS